jgi:hypothetical protein
MLHVSGYPWASHHLNSDRVPGRASMAIGKRSSFGRRKRAPPCKGNMFGGRTGESVYMHPIAITHRTPTVQPSTGIMAHLRACPPVPSFVRTHPSPQSTIRRSHDTTSCNDMTFRYLLFRRFGGHAARGVSRVQTPRNPSARYITGRLLRSSRKALTGTDTRNIVNLLVYRNKVIA